MGEVRDDPPVECQDETPLDKPYCLWTIEGMSQNVTYVSLLGFKYLRITGRNPGKYQQLCPEGELADLQSQGGPDKGCKDVTLDGQTNTVCVCFTDECNKSKEMAMKSGNDNDKGVANVIFISLSLTFLLQTN